VTLILLSLVPSLMAGLLGREQKQNVEHHVLSELALQSTKEPGRNSKEMSLAKADAGPVVPDLETILARMSQAAIQNQTHLGPYTTTREYELFVQKQDKPKMVARVVAKVIFLPPDSIKYSIQQSEGNVMGTKAVRRMLDGEAAIAKDSGPSNLSQDNYNFRYLREEVTNGQRCYVLQLIPRRKDKNLLNGTIWVDANTYLVRRTEGDPVKSPSWWVRDAHIVLVYGDVSGMWLPRSSEYTAKIRLLGPSTMVEQDLK
jgi:outer membrane lipoprotein-sorting protein